MGMGRGSKRGGATRPSQAPSGRPCASRSAPTLHLAHPLRSRAALRIRSFLRSTTIPRMLPRRALLRAASGAGAPAARRHALLPPCLPLLRSSPASPRTPLALLPLLAARSRSIATASLAAEAAQQEDTHAPADANACPLNPEEGTLGEGERLGYVSTRVYDRREREGGGGRRRAPCRRRLGGVGRLSACRDERRRRMRCAAAAKVCLSALADRRLGGWADERRSAG